MRRNALITALLVCCAPRLGHPTMSYGEASTIALVHPSNDPDRWYATFDGGDLGPQLWFVDTGYSFSTCDDDLVEGLSDVTQRGRVRIRGEAGDLYSTRATMPTMTLGAHTVRMTCVVRDLNATSSIADPPEVAVSGVLGADVLSRFDLVIDPSIPALQLLPRRGLERFGRDEPGVVPIRREYGVGIRFRVPVRIGDAIAWPVVDTGATGTYIDGDRLGLVPTLTQKGVSVRASGATGVVIRDLVYYHVEAVGLAGQEIGPLMLTDRKRGAWTPGLLGLNVLSELRGEYDFGRGLARFTPVQPALVPPWTNEKMPQ